MPLLLTVGNALDLFSLLLDPGEALLDVEGAREESPMTANAAALDRAHR